MMYGSKNTTQTDNDQAKPSNWDFELWKDLDPDYIESRWIEREQSRPLMMCAVVSLFFYIFMHIRFAYDKYAIIQLYRFAISNLLHTHDTLPI